jgi:anaerobic magnesium-protoporphyrin IX monomethyl ester cyclase
MKVALISPYSGIEATGLRILSACLKQAGFETCMIFLPQLEETMALAHYDKRVFTDAVLEQIATICANARFIGITVMTSSYYLVAELTAQLKARLDIPVIWGGIHPTLRPEECLNYADLVCIGEGERSIVELAQFIDRRLDYKSIPNLAWHDPVRGMVVNPIYPLNMDLDEIPSPDYDYTQHYILHAHHVVPFTQGLLAYYLIDLGSWASGPVYRVLATRGCPYRCSFCANNALLHIYPSWNHLRHRSVNNVIDEIKNITIKIPSIEGVVFNDDTFMANPISYIQEFSRAYRQEIGLPFRVYTTAQTANSWKFRLLADSGMRYIVMGIQSGSDRIQKLYQRQAANQEVLKAAQLIHQFQSSVPRPMYDIITDNPYESIDDRIATLQLVNQLPKPYRLSLFSLIFYPGTEIYTRANADGLIRNERNEIYQKNFLIIQPNYYNFALYCHSLNLPKTILSLLSRPFFIRSCSQGVLDGVFGIFLQVLFALRALRNKLLYTRQARIRLRRI